jgi:hypothetical protein
VVEYLGDPQGVLVIDETGFLKKGTKSVGASANTVARRDALRTARSEYFSPMPALEEGLFWTGSCLCPRSGPKIRSAGKRQGYLKG